MDRRLAAAIFLGLGAALVIGPILYGFGIDSSWRSNGFWVYLLMISGLGVLLVIVGMGFHWWARTTDPFEEPPHVEEPPHDDYEEPGDSAAAE
ncbi:MAG: hypothetical protein M3323_15135 [Actinomycetota bacterium]|nr:hypothetical protein [Actinomycetota bacterium]